MATGVTPVAGYPLSSPEADTSPAVRSAGCAAVCDAAPDSARFLASVLAGAGFEVITCTTAAACEAAVAARHPDLVVASILLPDLDGLALARRLRLRRNVAEGGPRIILVSTLHARQRALEAGADAFLLKPVAPADLLSATTGRSPPVVAATGFEASP